jgi:hypothetical protein
MAIPDQSIGTSEPWKPLAATVPTEAASLEKGRARERRDSAAHMNIVLVISFVVLVATAIWFQFGS